MKKEMITAIACLIVCTATAQRVATTTNSATTEFAQYITIGPRVGVNVSNVSGVTDAGSKAGLLAGAFIVYSFQEHFGVSADVLYSAEGAKFTNDYSITEGGTITATKSKNNVALNYLRIPLQANVFFGEFGNRLRPKVTLGPSLGFLLAAKNKFNNTTTVSNGSVVTTAENSNDADVKDQFKGVDLGAVLGAGVNFRLAEGVWWNFDLRYYIGATDINNSHSTLGNDAIKNNGFSASLGLGFGL